MRQNPGKLGTERSLTFFVEDGSECKRKIDISETACRYIYQYLQNCNLLIAANRFKRYLSELVSYAYKTKKTKSTPPDLNQKVKFVYRCYQVFENYIQEQKDVYMDRGEYGYRVALDVFYEELLQLSPNLFSMMCETVKEEKEEKAEMDKVKHREAMCG